MLRIPEEYSPKREMTKDSDQKLSEKELIEKIVQGETDLFRELLDAHKSQVFAMIMRQTGDAALAEELAQETFIKAFRGLGGFKGEAKFSTWITRIALNTTHSYFSSKRFKQSMKTVSFEASHHERMQEESGHEEQERRHAQFRECLSKLGQKFRETIVLHVLEKRSYDEVAGLVGIPIGTVRSRLHKARSLLKDCMLASDGLEEA